MWLYIRSFPQSDQVHHVQSIVECVRGADEGVYHVTVALAA